MDNQQSTLREMALFAGAGGGILGGHLLGWQTVCAVEWEPYPASVLVARQNDGIFPPFPIWDDVQTFDGKPWRGLVDVVSGGFPCQDISSAGNGAGIEGDRSSMWKHMARIVGEVRPRYVFVENSPLLLSRGAGLVIADLAEMGYDCQWSIISASDCGAPHQRDRFWLLAHTNDYEYRTNAGQEREAHSVQGKRGAQRLARQSCGTSCNAEVLADTSSKRLERNNNNGQLPRRFQQKPLQLCSQMADTDLSGCKQSYQNMERKQSKQPNSSSVQPGSYNKSEKLADTMCNGLQRIREKREAQGSTGLRSGAWCNQEQRLQSGADIGSWWSSEPDVGRVANGVAARVDRLKAIGNGQVSCVARTAFDILSK